MTDLAELTVYYDGACPLCRREIGFYRRQRRAGRVNWVDVAGTSATIVAPGLSREAALRRFHVRDAGGGYLSGGAAFARLWRALPAFRLLGRIAELWPLSFVLERACRLFLRVRPVLPAYEASRDTETDALPRWLVRDLRSDHGGETGAVAIYRGILQVSCDPVVRQFADMHLAIERQHLALIESILPPGDRSRLVGLWRITGFVTGLVPALIGPDAVFATIDAAKTFVDRHYADQIGRLDRDGARPDIRTLLERCRRDGVRHRDEARGAQGKPAGRVTALWCRLVSAGSATTVALARRL